MHPLAHLALSSLWVPILLLAQEISAKVLVDDFQLPGLEKVVDLDAANNITKLEALSTCINCITQECPMIDRSPWQLEKASVISNLRIGAAIPLRCIPCSSPKMVGLMVSGYKLGKQKSEKVGGCGEKSAPVVRSWVVWRPRPPLY